MSSLEYSIDALNVKSAFYRAETMVYVEGDDDVLFWETVLSRTTDIQFEIECVGGSSEIDKHIDQIESGELRALVARDSDLLPFISKPSSSPQILYTFGYSIENTLYTVETIYPLAKSWCKSPKVTNDECQTWLNEFSNKFMPLVHLDIANALGDAGVNTIGDNCTKFMTSQSSATPCPAKITRHVEATKIQLDEKFIAEASSALGVDANRIISFIRGHFLQSAVIKFLVNKANSYGKKVTISADSLYAAALANFGNTFVPTHPHYNHYATSSINAITAL
ncbi:DUF4435 domain-containing protein [Noviherbaspirillum sedimenti]|uniref:DUF4435 domain-containing protein n=1 Tax=Noviherbaspirillum sedimenti TaxID=2320865 RepID=A0A3A3FZV0_9BURK|nr:DUF4435 domain-containing protein [Noviherbaspirillum sedimenti]RJG00915.1 DUF4435 domain-containing protein [Noviherbaspirillum sedimenti]